MLTVAPVGYWVYSGTVRTLCPPEAVTEGIPANIPVISNVATNVTVLFRLTLFSSAIYLCMYSRMICKYINLIKHHFLLKTGIKYPKANR